jgi:hypothetical protein
VVLRLLELQVIRQKLGDLTPEEVGKEGFSRLNKFRDVWIRIYRSWASDTVVVAYEFELTDPKQSRLE